ncbi:MAG: hypothetical protein ACYCVN_08235 [Acidimicrobiales bacterium]
MPDPERSEPIAYMISQASISRLEMTKMRRIMFDLLDGKDLDTATAEYIPVTRVYG